MNSLRRALVLAVALATAACSTVGNDVVSTGPGAKKKLEVAVDPGAGGGAARIASTTSAGSDGSLTSVPAASPPGPGDPTGADAAGDTPADEFLNEQPSDNLDELPDPATDPNADPVTPPDYGRDLAGTSLPRPGSAGPVAPAPGSGPLIDGGAGPGRPALVVKVDNAWGAWPQSGVNEADVVFEILVEGISRFAAVYHSESPPLVGPIRSARTSDLNLVAMLNRPLFAWSGGNPGVQSALASSTELTDVGFYEKPGAYFRSSAREMPHNLYSSASSLWAAGGGSGPPGQIFDYRSPAAPAVVTTTTATTTAPASSIAAAPTTAPVAAAPANLGRQVGGVEYVLAATQVAFVWQQSTLRWLRYQSNYPHLDDNGTQISPTNVIVLETPYQPSVVDARSPEALTVGAGRALVLVEGRAIEGTWSRSAEHQAYSLVGDDGRGIELLPGRTWVALVLPGGSYRVLDTSFVKP